VFITEVERAEVAGVVLTLEQGGRVALQQDPALRAHRQTGDTRTGSWIEVVPAGWLTVELRKLLTDLWRVLVPCTVISRDQNWVAQTNLQGKLVP